MANRQQRRQQVRRRSRPPQRQPTPHRGTSRPWDWLVDRVGRRGVTVAVSVLYVALGLAYCFRWGSVVRHIPSLWLSPQDLSSTFTSALALAHGHLASVYRPGSAFLSLPGFLVALAPLGALGSTLHTTFVAISHGGHAVTGSPQYIVSSTSQVLNTGTVMSKARATEYAVQPQWFALVAPYVQVLSCLALFACDALAERLGVPRARRVALGVAEAVLLWPLVVFWGHPEDAVALGLVLYALLFALDGRFTGAGWLFGAAFAVQPLVVMVFPLLLVLGGRRRVGGLVARGVVPAVVVALGPLIANFHATTHSLVSQPTFPFVSDNHVTPWTFLAPHTGGSGPSETVGGGPTRIVVVVLACGVAWLARRWRRDVLTVVWAAALVLALRVYFESVLTSYYIWPGLAVGLVVAATGSRRRFGLAAAVAVLTTVVAQWRLAWLPWWCLDVGGLTALLLLAARRPPPTDRGEPAPTTGAVRTAPGRAAAAKKSASTGSPSTRPSPGAPAPRPSRG